MKPTNYHLFDFLDFDVDLKRDESLWKAYSPVAVEERDGDICVSVPFQKQVLDNDMADDSAARGVYARDTPVWTKDNAAVHGLRRGTDDG